MGLFAALVFKPAQFYAGRSGIYSVLGSINAVRALIAALKSAYEVEKGCPVSDEAAYVIGTMPVIDDGMTFVFQFYWAGFRLWEARDRAAPDAAARGLRRPEICLPKKNNTAG
jgi:hypothetical protein